MSPKNVSETSVDQQPIQPTDNVEDKENTVDNETNEQVNGTDNGATETKKSAYKARLEQLGRDAIGAEIPLELADMMRAAAKARGDIALSAWVRLAWAEAVNSANLEKDGKPWKFDLGKLEMTTARESTRGLSEEEKKKKAEEKKQADKDQRALVKQLLAEHMAKLAAEKARAAGEKVAADGWEI